MKIISSIILFIGLFMVFTPVYSFFGGDPLGGGYFTLFIGLPLILIGLTLFFSIVSSLLIFVGIIIYWIGQIYSLTAIIVIGLIILSIGLLYGISQGVYKIIKNH